MKQVEYIGPGSIESLRQILLDNRPRSIFLVTGKNSYESGINKIVQPYLTGCSITHFNGFEVNPKIDDIKHGITIFKQNKCDFVVSVGGGSVIDVAKSVNILTAQGGNPEDYVNGARKIENKGKVLVAIPTTSGSGSEATHFAVVYMGGNKYSLAHEFILPEYAVVDPNLTLKLPGNLTAVTGMDAISQAIESYWACGSTDESKGYAEEAIKLVLDNLREAVNRPSLDSRIAMSKAAHLAGKAINISKTTAPHAVSYYFTSHYGIPHGHAVALTLGSMFVYNSNINNVVIDPRGKDYLTRTMNELCGLLDVNTPKEAFNVISNLMKDIHLKTRLRDLGIPESDIDGIVKNVNLERLSNHPVRIEPHRLEEILLKIS